MSSTALTHDTQEPSSCSLSEDYNEDGSESDLLIATSQTVYQMAKIVRRTEINEEEKIFYSHLSLHCIRFQDYITRASGTLSRIDGDLVNTALCQFDSLISETGLQEFPCFSTKSRLKTLNTHWYDMQEKDDTNKIDFIRRWLKLGSSEEHLNGIDDILEECADKMEKQQPKSGLGKSGVRISSRDNYEPSYGVWRPAQALFDELLKCKACSCSKQHEFKAKLELGTFRRPDEKVQKKDATRNTPKRASRKDNSTAGILDFDMFLSMEHDWHEYRVQAAKERVVGFAMDGQMPHSHDISTARRVENLCKSIKSMRSKAWQRLVLKLSSGKLFKMGIEKSNFWIDQTTEPISLLKCFEERHDFFTEKTKRILSLIIGYAVLHLGGTSWLQHGWGSRDIKFFQTTSQKTPLRPFIQVHLPKANASTHIETDSESDDDSIFELFDSGHRCPELIALAVVLIEVYFAKPFYKLAQMNGIPLESPNGRITLFDVDLVFNGEEENKVEGWRYQIPEDSPLLIAIDNCLNPVLWENKQGNAFDNLMLKAQIYKYVVRPLELHLTTGFSKIPLDNVDNYARGLDFGGWGQPIVDQDLQGIAATSPMTASSRSKLPTPIYTPSPALALAASNQVDAQFIIPELQRLEQDSKARALLSLSYLTPNLDSISRHETNDYKTHHFFDDETGSVENSIKKNRDYLNWRSEYLNVYDEFITAYLPNPPLNPIKIAILDTGIDRGHDAFEAREEAIKARLNFYNESQRSIPDLNGHGTFTASLILDYAPDAELYIIKIADLNIRPSAAIVAKAIDQAVDKWGVDIISMSFGWPSSDFDGYDILESAIHRAYGKKVLLFAAASNSGGLLGRAYPASSSQVICVHSTDTLGNASAFSPTAQPFTLNFATVGESVESAWPMLLCDDKSAPQAYVKSRSGTSYATPIMAGMAAFLLQYTRLHISAEEALKFKSKENMEALLKRCAERGPNYAIRDGYFYIELSLNRHNLFGGKLEDINYEISKALRR